MSSSGKKLKVLAIGSGVAAVAGYVAGILSAPKSGKQTRQDIKVATEQSRYEAEKDLKKLHTDLNELLAEAKSKGKKASKSTQKDIKVLLEKTQDTKEKIREVISAIHEGDAEDQDLKRAINNANNALEHLKDYLSK